MFVAPLGFRGTTTSVDSPAIPDPPPALPLQNATSHITPLTIAGATLLEGNDAGIRPSPELGLAFAQKPGGAGDALFDGTGPFDADDAPGHDSSAGNLRVRTADITTYDFSITADNFALGQTTIDNVILEQVIIPNDGASIQFAVEAPTNLPTSCKTTGVSPGLIHRAARAARLPGWLVATRVQHRHLRGGCRPDRRHQRPGTDDIAQRLVVLHPAAGLPGDRRRRPGDPRGT